MKKKIVLSILVIIMILISSDYTEGNCSNMEYYFGELFRMEEMIEPAKNCYDAAEETRAYIRLAQIALQENNNQLAINILKNGLEKESEDPEYYFWLSRSYLARQEFEKAEEYVIKYQNDYGRTAASFILLGDIYSNQNQDKKAHKYYSQAVEIEPDNKNAHYRKWNLELKLNSTDLPQELANWLKDNPGDTRARNVFEEIKNKMGEDEISALHSRLVRLDSSSVREVAQNLLSKDNLTEAKSVVINYLRNNPENTDIVYLLGSIYLSQNKINIVRSILKTYPDFAESSLLKARIKRMEGENEQAVSIYWDYIKENTRNPDGYVGVGYLYLNSGRYDLAIRDFKSAIYLAPEYLDAYKGICRAYLKKGDIDSVFYWSGLGLKYFPASFALMFLRSQALYKAKEYNEVIRLLADNIPEDNNYKIEGLSYLAASYLNNNNYKNTIFTLEKLQKIIAIDNHTLQVNINLALNYAYNKLGMGSHANLAREKLIVRGADQLLEKELSQKDIIDKLTL